MILPVGASFWRVRFAAFALVVTSSAAYARADLIDAVFYGSQFGAINSATGAYTQISTLPIGKASGIGVDDGSTYVEDMADNLLLVDPVTGASKVLGNTGLGLDFVVFAGGASGLYGIDYQSNLYSFSPQNGAATLIGATGLAANQGRDDTSLSFDGNSLLYTAGLPGQADELYRIDIATGVATDLGSTGVTAIAGSAFSADQLDLFQYGQSTNYIYSAPDGSASFSRGATLGAQIVDGGVPATPTAAAPEPESVVMAASALVAIALYIRWRRRARKSAA